MSIDGINTQSPQQSAEQWSALLKATQSQKKTQGRHYIVLNGSHYESLPSSQFKEITKKISVAEIVNMSREQFAAFKKPFDKQLDEEGGYLTREEIKKFINLSSDIAAYTESIIQARENKRALSKLSRGIAAAFCCLTAIFGIGIYFGHKMWEESQKFKQEISNLRENVIEIRKEIRDLQQKKYDSDNNLLQGDIGLEPILSRQMLQLPGYLPEQIEIMHTLKEQIKELKSKTFHEDTEQVITDLEDQLKQIRQDVRSYAADIQNTEKELNLEFKLVAKYVDWKHSFFQEQLPNLNDDSYAKMVANIIDGTFNDQLDAYEKLDSKTRPVLIEQFVKDIPRKAVFQRIDRSSPKAINDKTPLPSPESTMKLSEASKAIAELIVDKKDEDWISILQLAVTQTNLNGAFFLSRIVLTDMGSKVTWDQGEKTYCLLPVFSDDGLPPAHLEVIRDQDGAIQQVNVSLEGSLDLVKQRLDANKEKEPVKTMVKGAVQTTLSYSITLGPDTRPILSNVKTTSTTAIPPIAIQPLQRKADPLVRAP